LHLQQKTRAAHETKSSNYLNKELRETKADQDVNESKKNLDGWK